MAATEADHDVHVRADPDAPSNGPSTPTGIAARRPRPLLLAIVAGLALPIVVMTAQGPLIGALAVAGAVGAVTIWSAVARFELFVLALLLVRSTLDLTDGMAPSAATKPAALLAMGMIAVSTIWLYDNRRVAPRRNWSPMTTGFVAFTVVACVSIAPLVNAGLVVGDVLAVLAGLLMYLSVERLLTFGLPLKRLMMVLFASTLVPVTAGLIGDELGLDTWHVKDGVSALRSTFVLSNNFAHYLMPVALLAIPIGHRLAGRWRFALYALAAIASYQTVLTYTRGAWIGFIVGVVVIGALENRRIIVGLVAVCLVGFLLVPAVRDRVTDLEGDATAQRDESSLDWRFEQWRQIIPWQESNRVTGIGFGMVFQLDEQNKAPHNDYVRAYVETGYLGLAAYLVMMFGFIRAAVLAHRRHLPGWRGGLAVGLLAYSIAFALTSLAENLIGVVAFLWYGMTLAAIANWLAYNDPSRRVSADGDPPPARLEPTGAVTT